jgi:tetratricopeptide (TPR) repeat protein
MSQEPAFDVVAAHKYFSAQCFNKAWDLLDKPERTAEEDEQMIRLGLASTWHWTQREDCTPTHMSTGYWQTSRIYATLGQADNARRYGQLCLEASQKEGVAPFYLGYAYEALARAESVAGDHEKMQEYLHEARRVADTVPDPDSKSWLLADLDTIR